jgi:hydroxyethylthiazole kinase
MFDKNLAQRASDNLKKVREKKPLIHNITNFVVMNYTANALLASGASPVMAHAAEEVEEMVSLAKALVLNIGTLTPEWVEAMLKAGKKANAVKVPIVLDPVGSGATRLRTDSAQRLARDLSLQVVRGNASEVLSLAKKEARTKGVDSVHSVDEAEGAAIALATHLKTTLAITGKVDLITDGKRILKVHNGHEMMGMVTGTGCTATVMIGAFLAVDRDALDAATTALAYFGLAGEKAAAQTKNPGTYQIALLDALFSIDTEELQAGAKIEVVR